MAVDDPDSEEKFKEATEAYEVLCDPERRQMYDAYGHEGMRRGAGGAGGFDFEGFPGFGDLFANLFGEAFAGGALGVVRSGRPSNEVRPPGTIWP